MGRIVTRTKRGWTKRQGTSSSIFPVLSLFVTALSNELMPADLEATPTWLFRPCWPLSKRNPPDHDIRGVIRIKSGGRNIFNTVQAREVL